ncbi:MAG TPA: acylphosphatase [Burkholderiales bacterium]|nr:acylphosphatase [Burkholderiales bacterium]
MKVTKHVIVHGRVQGVGFREYMRREAERLNVKGWVRNRYDGTVEAMVHGWPEDVDNVLDWVRRGPPAARVTAVQVNEASGEFESFEHRPSE